MLRSLIFFVAITVSSLIAAQPSEKTGDPGTTRSVILIIGDGFDDQHVTMGRNFLAGHDGRLVIDTLPVRAAVQVQTVGKDTDWVYVADSANTERRLRLVSLRKWAAWVQALRMKIWLLLPSAPMQPALRRAS